MSTRSLIGIQNGNDVKYIYCHWDGYPSHNGALLLKHYGSREKVQALIDLGCLSSLGEEIGEKHDFDYHFKYPLGSPERAALVKQCTFYGRDRDEPDQQACTMTAIEFFTGRNNAWDEYRYCFDLHGVWFVWQRSSGKCCQLTEEVIENDRVDA